MSEDGIALTQCKQNLVIFVDKKRQEIYKIWTPWKSLPILQYSYKATVTCLLGWSCKAILLNNTQPLNGHLIDKLFEVVQKPLSCSYILMYSSATRVCSRVIKTAIKCFNPLKGSFSLVSLHIFEALYYCNRHFILSWALFVPILYVKVFLCYNYINKYM